MEQEKSLIRLFRTESAALSELSLTTGGLAEHSRARAASNNGLGVREHGGHLEAALATHVHEETAGTRNKSLQLVLLELALSARMKDIDSQNHFV